MELARPRQALRAVPVLLELEPLEPHKRPSHRLLRGAFSWNFIYDTVQTGLKFSMGYTDNGIYDHLKEVRVVLCSSCYYCSIVKGFATNLIGGL